MREPREARSAESIVLAFDSTCSGGNETLALARGGLHIVKCAYVQQECDRESRANRTHTYKSAGHNTNSLSSAVPMSKAAGQAADVGQCLSESRPLSTVTPRSQLSP